ncbi:unnamed protein product [Strongylus vulgaris]|uniref:Uncharacterized protein n=1 Tax=Strongylus vulgaris TaxID=40348 RepID=A0A3P7K480_STRVU|nr:unnamed protein product [Strongylus vulgaris]
MTFLCICDIIYKKQGMKAYEFDHNHLEENEKLSLLVHFGLAAKEFGSCANALEFVPDRMPVFEPHMLLQVRCQTRQIKLSVRQSVAMNLFVASLLGHNI